MNYTYIACAALLLSSCTDDANKTTRTVEWYLDNMDDMNNTLVLCENKEIANNMNCQNALSARRKLMIDNSRNNSERSAASSFEYKKD